MYVIRRPWLLGCRIFVAVQRGLAFKCSLPPSGRKHQVEVVADVLVQVGQAVAVLPEVQLEPIVVVVVLWEDKNVW